MKFTYIFAFLFIILSSCNVSRNEVDAELDKFDNSLDSLITVKTYNKSNNLIFQSDTLHNNPKIIEETCYQIIGNDSIKIDANSHIYKFQNNQLVFNSSENFVGQKIIQKYIYFDDRIDNKLIEKLRKKKSGIIYFGNVNKYDGLGRLIKTVTSSIWNEIKNGITNVNDNRLVEVYRYNNDNTLTTWRKEYFNKKYNVDSLSQTKISIFTSPKSDSGSKNHKMYMYRRDKFGNWIEKRRNEKDYSDVYYRKYYY